MASARTLVVAAGLALGCRAPTEITVVLTTDIPCASFAGDNLYAGDPVSVGAGAMAAQTGCVPGAGASLGTFVLAPAGSDSAHVDVLVIAAETPMTPDQCAGLASIANTSCVLERRTLAFLPHTPLTLPIRIDRACEGIVCPPSETCSRGVCTGATVSCSAGQICTTGPVMVSDGGAADAIADAPREAPHNAADASAPSVFLFGGITDCVNFQGTPADLAWSFDGNTNKWTPVTVSPTPQQTAFASMVTLGNGASVLFGGYQPGGSFSSQTWLWDGTMWQHNDYSPAPSARLLAGMAALGGNAVLFGGAIFSPASIPVPTADPETWIFDGTGWTFPPGAKSSLAVRFGNPMSEWMGEVILVDGTTSVPDAGPVTDQSDMWLFDGTSWSRGVSSTGLPSKRDSHAMATLDSQVVLFGGEDEGFNALQDTWVWNAGKWSGMSTPAVPARYYSAMAAFGTSEVVMFGGRNSAGTALGDTWLWNGRSWSAGPPGGPSPRCGHVMVAR